MGLNTIQVSAVAAMGVVGIGALSVITPTMVESAYSNCHALEKRAVNSLVSLTLKEDGVDLTQGFGLISLGIMNAVVESSQGSIARLKAQQVAPSIPSGLTCSARWWVASLGGGDNLAREIRTEAAKAFNNPAFQL